MTEKRFTKGVAVGLAVLVLMTGAVAALQYAVYDEYNTDDELANSKLIQNMDIKGVGDSAYAQTTPTGGVDDNFDDQDTSEFSSSAGVNVIDLNGDGDYRALTSAESSNLAYTGTVGDYGRYAVSDQIQDSLIVPYTVDSSWSSKGTVGANASVNSNSNLELDDSNTYTSNSFQIVDDSNLDAVEVSVPSKGADVAIKLQSDSDGDGTWTTQKTVTITSSGTTTLSTDLGAGTYRVKLVAQGGTSLTTVDTVTVNGTDPSGAGKLVLRNTAGTSSDTSDDMKYVLKVAQGGNVTVTQYDNSAATNTQLMSTSVADTSKRHTYALERNAKGDLELVVDSNEVAQVDKTGTDLSIDEVTWTSENGHSLDRFRAPAYAEYDFYSNQFSGVQNAQNGYAKVTAQPGSEVTVEVYAIDDTNKYHFIKSKTIHVTESESATTTTVKSSAVSDKYQDYEVDVVGHGQVEVDGVGITYKEETTGVIAQVQQTTGLSGMAFWAVIGLVALVIIGAASSGRR